MSTLDSIDDLYMTLGILSPGVIILYVRSQFYAGRFTINLSAILSYFTVSFVYYAIVFPFFDAKTFFENSQGVGVLDWFLFVFFVPCGLGLFLGLDVQKGIFRRFLNGFGLNPVHIIPTAWDWKFSTSLGEQWVLVTLKDGTKFAGFLGKESFISSDPAERDIYIQWVYDIDETDKWTARNNCGAWIAGREIKTIEFWPYSPNGEPQ